MAVSIVSALMIGVLFLSMVYMLLFFLVCFASELVEISHESRESRTIECSWSEQLQLLFSPDQML